MVDSIVHFACPPASGSPRSSSSSATQHTVSSRCSPVVVRLGHCAKQVAAATAATSGRWAQVTIDCYISIICGKLLQRNSRRNNSTQQALSEFMEKGERKQSLLTLAYEPTTSTSNNNNNSNSKYQPTPTNHSSLPPVELRAAS